VPLHVRSSSRILRAGKNHEKLSGFEVLGSRHFKARRNLARPIDASGAREMSNQLPSSITERLRDNNAACRVRNSLACSSDSAWATTPRNHVRAPQAVVA